MTNANNTQKKILKGWELIPGNETVPAGSKVEINGVWCDADFPCVNGSYRSMGSSRNNRYIRRKATAA